MKTMNRIAAFALTVCLAVGASAQGFRQFTIEGGLADGSIKHMKEGPSKVEVIAGKDVDLKKVKCKYRLLSGCTLEHGLDKDFTRPQTIKVNKNDGTSKDWEITVKKINPAPLPLNLKFTEENPAVWTPETQGWVNAGTDEGKPMVVRFGNHGVSFIAAYEGEAKEVSFQLYLVGKDGDTFGGKFQVLTSADGLTWTDLEGFDGQLTIEKRRTITCALPADARYIKWLYVTRDGKQNVNLNNICVK